MALREETPDEQEAQDLTEADIAAAARLIAEGVEFEQFIRHMNTLLKDKYGVIFARGYGSAWYAKRHGFPLVPSTGDKKYWISAADLLMDVFALVTDKQP